MDKKYSIRELVDIDQLRGLFETFSKATGFTTGFVSYPDQELLITTGWRDICTKFHRACPASAECCKESNIYLTACLKDLKELSIKPCGNGLVDAATPIVIRGVHLASLATGQVLLAKPDIKFFKGLAQKYGYDTKKYLAALAKVPVVSEEQLKNALKFLSGLAVMIAERGLSRLQILESAEGLEEALSESENRYRSIVESFEGFIYVCNKDYRIEFMNQRFVERTGWNPVGEFCYKALHQRESVCPWCVNDRVFAGETVRWEVQSPKDDRWYYVVSNPIHRSDGTVVKQSMITDITERKLADEALKKAHDELERRVKERTSELQVANAELRKKEASLRTLSDNIPNGIIYRLVRTESGHSYLEYISAGIERLYGIPVDCALADARSVYAGLHPDDAPRIIKAGEESARLLRTLNVEGRIITPAGEVRWMQWRSKPRRLENGDTLSDGIATDITSRKTVEEALLTSEAQLRSISNAAQDAVVMMDDRGHISFWNDAAVRMFGYSAHEAIGRDLHQLIMPQRYSSMHYKSMARFRTTGKGRAIGKLNEFTAMRKDKVEFPVELSLASVRQGKNWHAVGIIRDITERKTAEKALKRANRALLTIKECTNVLARAKDESELLRQTCRIIVDIGGAKMAWVGFAEDDESKTVRPVASAGDDSGYLKGACIKWGKNPPCRSPTGSAIRTREVNICHDIASIPRPAPWQKKQLKLGYATSVAFPLVMENRCIGALTIFSSEVNAFNEEEVEMFKQLATDMTYGIIALRNRAERERLQHELLTISDRERQLISQELHDGLCQNLAGTALMLNLLQRRLAAAKSPEAAYAKRISEMLSTNVNETRNLSHGLHPVGPENEGLMNALSQLAETVCNLFHIHCFFRCPDPVLIKNEVTSTHLLRIAQEAINNARRHGEADRILITLLNTSAGIVLTIRDNGIGIPQKLPKKRGLGLRTMNYRASEIGATLTVRRAGKQGTVICCTLAS